MIREKKMSTFLVNKLNYIEFGRKSYMLFDPFGIQSGTTPVSKLPVKYLNKIKY